MRIKTNFKTSLTKNGSIKVTTRTKVPMLPVMRTSTTLTTSPPRGKRGKKS